MRVQGDLSPQIVELQLEFSGMVRIMLRENIREVEIEHEGIVETKYEYDEYVIYAKYYNNLENDVREHLADWMATGRDIEFSQNASKAKDMEDALKIFGVNANE